MIGTAHKNAILTVVGRKSGFSVLPKVDNNESDAVNQDIISQFKPYDATVVTLTYDSGKEFTYHARIDAEHNSTGYFPYPIVSWQREL